MEARCLRVIYQPGSFEVLPSERERGTPRGGFRTGQNAKYRGHGNWNVSTASRFVLEIELAGEVHEIWITHFFQDNWGKLIAKRRTAIERTMPATIQVEEKIGRRGQTYYEALVEELHAWLTRAIS